MITDLQGVGNLLTDPAIHCSNRELFKERTNLGDKGIKAFYATDLHTTCNQVCKKLALERPDACAFEDIKVEMAMDDYTCS